MKTKTNMLKSCIAFIVLTTSICNSEVRAQSDPDDAGINGVNEAIIQLDALTLKLHNEIMYVAPANTEDDMDFVLDRLQQLTARIESEVLYKVPENMEMPVNQMAENTNDDTDRNLTDLVKKNSKRK